MNEEELKNWYRNNFNKLKEEPPAGVWKNIAGNLEFGDWYKKNFNTLNEEPPAEVWQNVSNQLDLQDWYKNTFNKMQEEPPAEVWENVSNELDVKDVWGNVNGRLDAIARRKQLARWLAYAASALLLVIGATRLLYPAPNPGEGKTLASLARAADHAIVYQDHHDLNPHRSNDNNTASHTNHNSRNYAYNGNDHSNRDSNSSNGSYSENNSAHGHDHGNNSSKDNQHKGENVPRKNEHGDHPSKKDGGGNLAQHPSSSPPEHSDPEKGDQNDSDKPAPGDPVPFQRIDLYPVYVSVNLPYANMGDLLLLPIQDGPYGLSETSPFQGFYGGLSFTYNNTWLLNKKTITAYSRTNLTQANVHFTRAFGFSAGYNFNQKFGLEMDCFLRSVLGQTYHVYDEGQFGEKKTEFFYRQVDVAAHFRKESTVFTSVPSARNLILGLNMMSLRSATETLHDTITEITNNYSRYDLGLHLGFGYELMLMKNLVLSASLTGNLGLLNIYRGDANEPGSFRKTFNATLGVNAGIRYIFRGKKGDRH